MKVGLFVTCLVDLMRPRIGFAALRLLEAAGCEVVVPASQTCCGQPAWNSGDRRAARLLAEKMIAEFEGCDYIVAPSGSCAGTIRTHYPELFADDAAWLERAAALGSRTYELADFLATVAKLPGVMLTEMNGAEECCGFGGTFSVKFGEISARLAEKKCENMRASGADAVVLGDLGCMLNIEGKLRRLGDERTQVLHIAEVLAGEA